MTRSIDVEGSLDVAGPGGGFTLAADGSVLRCEVRSVSSGLVLLRLARAEPQAVRAVLSLLDLAGLRLSILYRGRVVIDLGAGLAPTWISSGLGLPLPHRRKV